MTFQETLFDSYLKQNIKQLTRTKRMYVTYIDNLKLKLSKKEYNLKLLEAVIKIKTSSTSDIITTHEIKNLKDLQNAINPNQPNNDKPKTKKND